MRRHTQVAIGALGLAVAAIVVGEVFPIAHADSGPGRISLLGIVIITLLLVALGSTVVGNARRRP